jgi:hypothetical protein
MQQTTRSPQFVVPEPNAFPHRRLMSILCSETTLKSSASHNMHSTYSSRVDIVTIVTELTESHQLAHALKPGMEKKSEFYFR